MTTANNAIIMIGAMGSGKTHIAKLLAKEFGLVYINPDNYWERDEPYSWGRVCENWSRAVAKQYRCVKMGFSFVLDTSSRVQRVRQEATRVVKAWSHGKPGSNFRVIGFYVDTSLDVCLRRNQARENSQSSKKVMEYHDLLQADLPKQREDGFDILIKFSNDEDCSDEYIKRVLQDFADKGAL